MHKHCPRCQEPAQRRDLYCHACGARFEPSRLVIDDDYQPVPGVVGQPDMRVFKQRREPRAVLLRRGLLIGTVAGVLAVAGLGGYHLLGAAGKEEPTSEVATVIDTGKGSFAPLDHARLLAQRALDLGMQPS